MSKIHSSQSINCLLTEEKIPASICLLKGNNRNTRTRFKICSKLTVKTLERRQRLVLSQSYFKVPKTIRLNAIHYFMMGIPNNRELQ